MKLYNTMSRTIEDFKPMNGKKVKMYTCGLTVYSHPQIGNWVAYIYADVLNRTLLASGYQVERVQNITDVGHLTSDEDAGEDKMLKGALKEGLTAWEVADKYIAIADKEAFEDLHLLRPQQMPRATKYIEQQIEFVKKLEEKGYTYQITDGVYFDTKKLDDYGKLAKLDIEGLRFGARVEDTGKRNPTDFAVWKFSDPSEKRDMEWDSPWGKGFPGWHLECSAMILEILGEQIDLHTGGIDHIPVHHTNEIAQSETLNGKEFVKYWFHNNHIKVNGTKLAKSLGNSYTLDDIREKGFELDAYKLLVLSSHYRTEGNFSWEILEANQNRLNRLYAMADLRWQTIGTEKWLGSNTDINTIKISLENDLNTPIAVSALSGFAALAEERLIHRDELEEFTEWLETVENLLGLELSHRSDITDAQKQIFKDRQAARDNKDWSLSDQLRDQLKEQGLAVRDTDNGQIWSRI